MNVAIADIKVGDNVRTDLGDIDGLTESIKLHGVIVPVTLTEDLRLVAGFRRLTAATAAGLTEIPAHTIGQPDDTVATVMQVVENCQRKDLAPTEYAQAYAALQALGLNQRDIATQVGVQQATVSRKLALLKLSAKVAKMVDNGDLSERLAAEIAKISDHAVQEELAQEPTEFRIQQAIDFQDRVKGTDGLIKAMANAGLDVVSSAPPSYELVGQYLTLEAWQNAERVDEEVLTIGPNFDGEPAIKVWVPKAKSAAIGDIHAKARRLADAERLTQLRKAVAKAKVSDVLMLAANQLWERSTTSAVTARQVARYLELDPATHTKMVRSTNNEGEAIESPQTDWVGLVSDFYNAGGRSGTQAVAALLVSTGTSQPLFEWLATQGVQEPEVLTEHFLAELRNSTTES